MHSICQGLEPGLLDAEGHLFWGGGYVVTLPKCMVFSTGQDSADYLTKLLINGKEMVERKQKATHIV